MTSYNLVNGVYANENRWLLQTVLRDEWGFDALVVTDWGGGNDSVAGVQAGSSLEMPTPGLDSAQQLVAAVEAGKLTEQDVNARVLEVLTLIKRTNTSRATPASTPADFDAHHLLARRAAAQSAVLLRNENDILPLKPGVKVAVVGDFARNPRYQGTGSSKVNPIKVSNPLDALKDAGVDVVSYSPGFLRDGSPNPALITEAVTAAAAADVVLLYLGLPETAESEGIDRSHLRIPAVQVELLQQLSAANPAVVVVLAAGGVLELPWASQCQALLHAYLGGQAGAEGAVDVLIGTQNPGGKLSETYPVQLADIPSATSFPSNDRTAEYREGLYVGYRYFETADVPVAFEFGFGLSYTTFEYSELTLSETEVSFKIRNTGTVAGSEIAQVYVSRVSPSEVYRPARILAGFAKVSLAPSESQEIRITLPERAFQVWDTVSSSWQLEAGEYQVLVGASVKDIRLRDTLQLTGSAAQLTQDPALACYHHAAAIRDGGVPDAAFAALLGRPIPEKQWGQGALTLNDPLLRLSAARSPLARLIGKVMESQFHKAQTAATPDLNVFFRTYMPFRAIAKMTNGLVTMAMVDAILTLVNGKHLRGLGQLIKAFFQGKSADREFKELLAEASS
jgi:beta-glucosidase